MNNSYFDPPNPRYEILQERWWKKRKLRWLESYTFYWWNGNTCELVYVSRGTVQDGHSIPLGRLVGLLTFGRYHPMMEGLKAAGVHDKSCKDKLFTRRKRRHLYRDSLDVCNIGEGREFVMWQGVAVASKWFGFC